MAARITGALFLAVTALTAYLVVTLVEGLILDQAKGQGPYLATLIGMVLIVFVFVPLFQGLEGFSQKLVSWVTKSSARAFGRYGLYIFFVAALGALYLVYLYVWFNLTLI